MQRCSLGYLLFGFILLTPSALKADDASSDVALAARFRDSVLPLFETHCLPCHDAETREAELDVSIYKSADDVARGFRTWEIILERVEAGEMPPSESDTILRDQQRKLLVDWMREMRQYEASKKAGDPGPVLARRLSNAEYDYSIRDLTGVDIRPTRTFPVDPANEAGFDNSGESLAMSPALLNKYLEAARTVTEHLVLTPTGIRFASHPVVTDTDRDKYCVKRIVEFYDSQPTAYADYFYAAWLFQNRAALGTPDISLEQLAFQQDLSVKYLATIWNAVSGERVQFGPMADVQEKWNALPVATSPMDTHNPGAIKDSCQAIQDYIVESRKLFEPTFENLDVKGIHAGAQAFVLWKNDQYASCRRKATFSASNPFAEAAADREQFEADCQLFCETFPDAFYISERGRDYLGTPREKQEKGRLLNAGFHSMMGYYRDDQPLYDMVLSESQRKELDALWQELNFFAAAPMRQYQGFLWFERTDSGYMRDPEFDFARPENQAALEEAMIERLRGVYTAKAIANGAEGVALEAIEDYFRSMNDQIRWVEQTRLDSRPAHLDAVVDFASRAYRRPLAEDEQKDLRSFYEQLRREDGLSHEEAIEDTIVAILMSPQFCYRVDLLADSPATRTLTDIELASRLSFFLWSSVPDEALMRAAESGQLSQPEILLEQTKRMLHDDRARALAVEFGGNWLDFRRFEEHNSVDRERFPEFDDELRKAMFEEPIRFFVDVIQNARSMLDFLYAKDTFVNEPLARHYGITGGITSGIEAGSERLDFSEQPWQHVSEADRYGRGGLLSMSVFLTKNSPGLRTSPVKRGYWVVRRLLGERIPAPPPNVPELPADESLLGDLTLRETLAKHRDHASCAGCHNRIDSVGLVFEGFGPVGEKRELDLGGRPVDTEATFPDGSQRQGVEDLRRYIQQQREADFVDNLCRKLLSYALGRSLILSDDLLVTEMQTALGADGFRFNCAIETIVASPQFQNKRGRSDF